MSKSLKKSISTKTFTELAIRLFGYDYRVMMMTDIAFLRQPSICMMSRKIKHKVGVVEDQITLCIVQGIVNQLEERLK